ncbi:hypothetical protein M2650_02380 [Luteimonas sp. SX5]|uniref:Uncharacterized protein n=1 Tax=Luteimonas galliterrae TaxID=2940486 RepID=A0ABT0MF48_9GAMM|nr:hypothetical protein [Luteimonas galliterrae]MCL1633496.1 hypothetical protein [Luteimonas galliterrae]
MTAFAAAAAEPQADAWVQGPERPSLNGEAGKTWFSPVFGRRSGTFPAMYDSMQDTRDSVTGDFLVARFRYTYDAPIGEGSKISPRHDESITEVLLDCDRHFSGTASIRYLLDGKEVARQDDGADDILMTQMENDAGTTVGDLCEFARQRGAK